MARQKPYKHREQFVYNGVTCDVKANTAKDLAMKINKAKAKIDSGERRAVPSMTVRNWHEKYLETYKEKSITPDALYILEKSGEKWILSVIGDMCISDVRPIDCQQIVNGMDGMSSKHIKRIYYHLHDMFAKAQKNMNLPMNPAEDIELPKAKDGKGRAATDTEQTVFLGVCSELSKDAQTRPYAIYGLLMYHCGLMPMETSIIQGRHIDLKDKKLKVEGTKTAFRNRTVPIPDALCDILREQRCEPFAYLLTNEKGKQLTSYDRKKRWARIVKEMNIAMGCEVDFGELRRVKPPYRVATDFTAYCMRHTYAVNLRDAGVNLATAAEFMGHSGLDMLKAVYLHPSDKSFTDALEKINAFGGTDTDENTNGCQAS